MIRSRNICIVLLIFQVDGKQIKGNKSENYEQLAKMKKSISDMSLP